VRVGVLTGGGDCPGLNAVIRAAVFKGEKIYGSEFVGLAEGWKGAIEGIPVPLDRASCQPLISVGGTILGTSRTNPFKVEDGPARLQASFERLGLDALIAIGGEDTLGAANLLHSEHGLKVVGVPKTIDNDLSATEVTFGFHTSVQIVTEAIDRLHTTAESHGRVIVCEVMGRHAGWIATYGGIAGNAAVILIPEEPFDIDEVCEILERQRQGRRVASIVVVAEGAVPKEGTLELVSGEVDQFGHVRLGGIGERLASEIESRTGFETRATVLGHIQRGGSPVAYDRILATRFGIAAIDAVADGDYGKMVALRADRIVRVPLAEAVAELKTVDSDMFNDVAGVFVA
jgi:phosphofructokinase-like protein